MAEPDLSWVPDRHLGVAATLAHVDDLMSAICDLVFRYSEDGAALTLTEVADGPVSRTRVTAVRQVPRALPLYVADALTTLRAAIEHTLFAEVEHATGRELTEREARSVEMPAHTTAETFDRWVRDREKRGAPTALGMRSPLVRRIRELQPYQRRKSADEHPLRLLVAHTNLVKHRMPALAASRVARVVPDVTAPGLVITPPTGEPVRAGDDLASTPLGMRVPVSIFATIGLRRPHTGTWPVLVNELDYLAAWVRTVAIPVLITGSREVDPFPVNYASSTPHEDERTAILAGTTTTATDRLRRRLDVTILREDLPEILSHHPDKLPDQALRAWVESLDDDEVLERGGRLEFAHTPEAMARMAALGDDLIAEARAFNEEQQQQAGETGPTPPSP